MKVVFVTPEYVTEDNFYDGGLANYLFRVALSLKILEHEPLIIVASNKTEILDHNEIQVHRVCIFDDIYNSLPNSSKWMYQSLLLNHYLAGLSATNAIDIVQYANFSATGFYRINDLPAITRISSWFPLLRKNYNLDLSADMGKCERLESYCLKNTDAIFGPSKYIANFIKETEKIDINIIESPFINDVNSYDYSLYNKSLYGKKYLLFFGTLSVLKGLLNISEIIGELLKFNPDLYFVFIGKDIGYDSKKIVDILKDNAGSYHKRIVYYDKMKHDKLYPVIEKSFAVILPSRIDNFPNACIEAMAHKKIVIGTLGTGFEQLIENGVNGFLCEKDNPVDILRVITRVLNLADTTRHSIENKAYARIQLLSPEITVNQLIKLYTDVIATYRSKPKTEHSDFSLQFDHDLIDIIKKRTVVNDFSLRLISHKIYRKVKKLIKHQ